MLGRLRSASLRLLGWYWIWYLISSKALPSIQRQSVHRFMASFEREACRGSLCLCEKMHWGTFLEHPSFKAGTEEAAAKKHPQCAIFEVHDRNRHKSFHFRDYYRPIWQHYSNKICPWGVLWTMVRKKCIMGLNAILSGGLFARKQHQVDPMAPPFATDCILCFF